MFRSRKKIERDLFAKNLGMNTRFINVKWIDMSPIKAINAITNRNQKEFLVDLIGKISNDDTKRSI